MDKSDIIDFPRRCCCGMMNSFKRDIQQIYALTMKNITLHWRQWKANLCGLLTPILCMFFMFLLQLIVTYILVPRITKDVKGKKLPDIDVRFLDLFAAQEFAMLHNLTEIPRDILYTFEENKKEEKNFILPFPEPDTNFINKSTSHEINKILFDSMGRVADEKDYQFPYVGSLKFDSFETSKKIDYTIQYVAPTNEGRANRRTGVGKFCRELDNLAHPGYCEFAIGTSLMNYVNTIPIYEASNKSTIIRTTVSQMPYKQEEITFDGDLIQLMGTFFYPLILLLSLPTILYTLVLEKESKLKEMMRLMGLKERNYVVATYCFKFVWFCLALILFILLGVILQHRVFIQTNYVVILSTFVGSGFLVVSLSFCVSSFVTSSFVATVVGYIIVIFTPVIGIFLIRFVMLDGSYEYKWLLLVPPLPIVSTVQQMVNNCLLYRCLSWDAYSSNYDFLIAFIMLYVDAIIYFLLSLYIDAVTPKPWGVRKSPLFFLEWLFCCCRSSECCPNSRLFSFCRRGMAVPDQMDEGTDDDVREAARRILGGEVNRRTDGIVVDGLVKDFGKKRAVNGLYFNVHKKECFGLLGPNGAGKTTTIRILCGLFAPSGGTSYVDNHDIRNEMELIRDKIGLCPQFSVVWPDLTCREHLLFYCRLKSLSLFQEYKEADAILRNVGLETKTTSNCCLKILQFFFPRERKAKQLSGGMRRRLSIGISLCGDPKILLLDEPTTGLDPENRRSIWDVILREKKGRCVVLTTHSMEEADSLSDRIGIVQGGKLAAIGTKLHLKKKFGNGYTLTLKYGGKTMVEEVENKKSGEDDHPVGGKRRIVEEVERLLSPLADVHLIKEFGSHLTYQLLPRDEQEDHEEEEEEQGEEIQIVNDDVDDDDDDDVGLEGKEKGKKKKKKKQGFSLFKIFETMENCKKSLGIVEFEVNQTTLEDVFLNVIRKGEEEAYTKTKSLINQEKFEKSKSKSKKHQEEEEDDDDNNNNMEKEEEEDGEDGGKTAMIVADGRQQAEEDDPLLFEVEHSSGGINEEEEDLDDEERNMLEGEVEVLYDNQLDQKNKKLNSKDLEVTRLPTGVERFLTEMKDNLLQTFFLLHKNCLLSVRVKYQSNKWYIDPERHDIVVDSLVKCKAWAGRDCYTLCYTTNNDSFSKEIMDDFVKFYKLGKGVDYREFKYERDLEKFLWDNKNVTQCAISFSNKTEISPVLGVSIREYGLFFNETIDLDNQVIPMKLIIDNFILYHIRLKDEKKYPNPDRFSLKGSKEGFPKIANRVAVNGQSQVFSSTGPLFFTCAAMVLFLVSLYRLVFEKEHQLRSGLEMIGMRQCAYFTSWMITFSFFGALMSLVTVISGYIFVIDVFVYSNPVFTFLLFFVFDLSLVCFAFALSPFLTRTKTALILGFIILAITFILNLFIANGTLCYFLFNLGDEWFWVPLIFEIFYPPFNFAKFFQDIIEKTVKKYDSESNEFVANEGYWGFDAAFQSNKMEFFFQELDVQASFISLLFLFLNIIGYMVVFWYFDNVCVSKRSPFFPFFCCCSKDSACCCLCFDVADSISNKKAGSRHRHKLGSNFHPKEETELTSVDSDLKQEYDRVRDPQYPASIRIANLKKKYRSILGKTVNAVNGIDLTLERGSVLGLLGHNGAGKSTTINTIAGLIHPSGGSVLVDDLSTTNYRDVIRKDLGVTLQHNLLWDDLTAKDHVRLFGQIKGIIGCRRMKREIEDRLSEVSLFHVRNDRTKTFSGGMKRRLSVALGYVNKPNVVLLDEPTTGLDPFSKREVWNLIREKKKYSSILLTTHSMEEADHLSEKIAILQKGNVSCVGDSLHLKSKYGAGYVLKFNCEEGKELEFEDLVSRIFPHSRLESSNACNYIYNIGTEYTEELIHGLKEIEELVVTSDDNNDDHDDDEEEEEEKRRREGGTSCVIKNFGISNTTLEAVYLRVTKSRDHQKQEDKRRSILMRQQNRNMIQKMMMAGDQHQEQQQHQEEEEEEESVILLDGGGDGYDQIHQQVEEVEEILYQQGRIEKKEGVEE